ncbi:MAG: hypothetical protein E6767_10030 [Dysgonomonas sp.]|nr:hypothetical protein [Dysgonomonas sp.]
MKQLTILLLFLLLCISQQATSQVTIGLDQESVTGALLQLMEKTPDGNNVNASKGLNLPRVALVDATGANEGLILQNTLGLSLTTPLSVDEGEKHAGLLIFNTQKVDAITNTGSYKETKICPGVYVWLGDQWARAMVTPCN